MNLMKKRLAIFYPHSGNIGDSIHSGGIEYLLSIVLDKKDKQHRFIQHGKPYENYDLHRSDYSHIVLAGAPYLFEKFWNTYKYGVEIRQLFKQNKQAKKIALGIGSCFAYNYRPVDIFKDPLFLDNLHDFYDEFDLIIVRDELAQRLFEKAGIKSYLLPCPSMFIYNKYFNLYMKKKARQSVENLFTFTKKNKLMQMLVNPNITSAEMLSNKDKARLINFQKNIFKKFNLRTGHVVFFNDANMMLDWRKEGIQSHIYKINNRLDLLDQISQYDTVITGRLHTAIPASLSGCDTYLIPFDSRHRCAEFFNIKVINTIKDIKPYSKNPIDIQKYEDNYVRLLGSVL